MNFPNPFKKKENNEFKLDDETLPSLSENNAFSTTFPETPSLTEPAQTQQDDSFTSPKSYNTSSNMPSFSSPSNFASQSSSFSQPQQPQQTYQNDNSSFHHDLNRSQMETTIAKITLIEAKLFSIEQKLDVVLKVLAEEVSEETQRKIKVKQMMDTIKNS